MRGLSTRTPATILSHACPMLGCLLRICAFAGIFLAAPLAIAAFLIFVVFNDNMSAHYATHAEARGDGIFGRGWLPRALPDSSFDIDVWGNLDSLSSGGEQRCCGIICCLEHLLGIAELH